MKKYIYVVLFITLIGGLAIWKHTEVNAKYKNFAVNEQVVAQADLPVALTDGLTLDSLTKKRSGEHIHFKFIINAQHDNVPFKTNDFALGFHSTNRGWDFSDFDPGETKINGQSDEILRSGKNVIELSILDDPDSEKSTLFYLGKQPNTSYKQIQFLD